MSSVAVNVHATHRGGWEIALSDGRPSIRCETLDEARRVAHLQAARARPCELVIRDAYERVVERELINARSEPVHG